MTKEINSKKRKNLISTVIVWWITFGLVLPETLSVPYVRHQAFDLMLCSSKLYFEIVSAMFPMLKPQWLEEKISFSLHEN